MSLKYQKGYIFEGHTFVANKSDVHNAKDEQFVEGTALLPIEEPKPLTLDELWKMDGEPVWIDYMDGFATWRIIESVDNPDKPYARIHFYETIWKHLFDYGKTWLAYRTKPERSGK